MSSTGSTSVINSNQGEEAVKLGKTSTVSRRGRRGKKSTTQNLEEVQEQDVKGNNKKNIDPVDMIFNA